MIERGPRPLALWAIIAGNLDLPHTEIHLLDARHCALDEKNDEIASLILELLTK